MSVAAKPKRKRAVRKKAAPRRTPRPRKKEVDPAEIKIRRFTKNDMEAVRALIREWDLSDFAPEEFNSMTLVAQNGSGIVGMIQAKAIDDGTYVLENFLVSKNKTWAGRGLKPNRVGLKLYRGIIQRLAEKKVRRIAAVINITNPHTARIMYKLFGANAYKGMAHIFMVGK
jgi:hypothetical protein